MVAEKDRLIHGVYVACELRFVGAEASRGVEDPRRNVPSGIHAELVALGIREDIVVALGEILQDLEHLLFRCAGRDTEEGKGVFTGIVVVLRREEIHLRLSRKADELRVLVAVVNMMRERP